MAYAATLLGPDAVPGIIREAVLRARRPGAPELAAADRDPENWHISRGQEALARLMKLDRDRFRGPVFTTNFDPLIGLALQAQGLSPDVRPILADTDIPANPQAASEAVEVFHLHGYWRQGNTLNTAAQLGAERPALVHALEDRLSGTALVVMAYGGWDDIITRAMRNGSFSQRFDGEIIWCFHEENPELARLHNRGLIDRLTNSGIVSRVSFFCGVDCHEFLDGLAQAIEPEPAVRAALQESPLAGWAMITPDYLGSLPGLTAAEEIAYFDGSVPGWRHAMSPQIPRLGAARKIVEALGSAFDIGGTSLQLVRAAGGEGKTTALLQAAAEVIRAGRATGLHANASGARLDPDRIAALDPDRDWLIVADDAEAMVEEAWDCAGRLGRAGRSNVHFLLAARDTDWRQAGGDTKPWATVLRRLEDVVIGALGEDDARAVVEAWARHGAAGLRALGTVPEDERVDRLVRAAARQDTRRGEGSFFGGLLDTRFTTDGLLDHVVAMMGPLRDRPVGGSGETLLDALVGIANCHAVGMPGIDRRVLAALCDIPERMVGRAVVAPLGRELGAAESRGHVLTRHRKVAEAVVVAAEARFGIDLEDVWQRMVVETVRLGREHSVSSECHGPIIHAGPRLKDRLPQRIAARRRGYIGIAAAEAAMDAMPEWSSTICDLASALRSTAKECDREEKEELIREACELMRGSLRRLQEAADLDLNIRGYFHEWGTCCGNLGTRKGGVENVWLGCFSLADRIKVPVTLEDAKLACAGLGVAFGALGDGSAEGVFPKARRGVAFAGRLVRSDAKLHYYDHYDEELDRLGTPYPADLDEALAWLAEGARAAHGELDDALLRKFAPDGMLGFARLKEALTRP